MYVADANQPHDACMTCECIARTLEQCKIISAAGPAVTSWAGRNDRQHMSRKQKFMSDEVFPEALAKPKLRAMGIRPTPLPKEAL